MPDDDPFLWQFTSEDAWREAGAEPDLALPLPPIPGSNEPPGVMLYQ